MSIAATSFFGPWDEGERRRADMRPRADGHHPRADPNTWIERSIEDDAAAPDAHEAMVAPTPRRV
jgi:hypothetical protein